MFCKLLESEVFGQIVVMRDFEGEKEKVKIMFACGGAVQEIGLYFEKEDVADKALEKLDVKMAEEALNPFIEMGMVK